jgi:hypothetical protein
MEFGVEDWLNHIEQRLLHYSVANGGYAKRPFASVWLRYLCQPGFQVLAEGGHGLTVYPGSPVVGPDGPVCSSKAIYPAKL